ncbi:hypothetical protein FF011L_00840 [Roseimaritima multifibrata]|uniref:Uncharacterized protein n=1 Tax=Roseimaritima multifibrata TaxID=1930274 RepID=A0A517M8Z1_9BACT|nr:hypothetical protein [Roseimaritima multifibrata]QDS91355.1 hypothetical protein FF011L_00840 [Roseimaritima multifibrata]
MTCAELAERIDRLQPGLSATDVARLCLLILNQASSPLELSDDDALKRYWQRASFKLDAATDQMTAMANELDTLCGEGSVRFDPEQIWTLLRAAKVHGQMLELYSGEPAII